jgi:LysR family hydrogen peroxide-inducible transcriptional activator
MNLNQLDYLRELLYRGSFTRAARSLGISQPALSTQIKKLEEETGLALIDRNARPVQLTRDGVIFYEMALDILQRLDALKNLPVHLADEIEGELRMGMIPTLAPYFLALFIDELNNKYPGLELIIEELITEEIIHKIRTGHLDAGIISTPVEARNLNFRSLFYEQFFLYVADRHPLYEKEELRLSDIDLDEIWYLQEGNCFRNQVNAICSLAGKRTGGRNLVYQSNSIESLRRIVESRHGLTFIPELATMQVPSEQEDMIKPIAGSKPVREISLIYGSLFTKKRLLEAFTAVVLSQLPQHMKSKPAGWVVDTDLRIESRV